MTVYSAIKHYKILQNTLSDRITDKNGHNNESGGRNAIVSRENYDERHYDGALTVEKNGYALSRK